MALLGETTRSIEMLEIVRLYLFPELPHVE